MKTEQLKEQGLTKEQIDFVMAENGKDIKELQNANTTLTAEKDMLEKERDGYKKSIDDLQKKLDGFKDVNVEDLKGQIATLTADLDEEKKARAHDAQVVEQEKTVNALFDSVDDKGTPLYPFMNDITRDHYKTALLEELDKDTAKGKSAADLFKAMITDADGKTRDGIFINAAEQNRARFTTSGTNTPPPGTKLSMSELMRMKNENPGLDIKQYM